MTPPLTKRYAWLIGWAAAEPPPGAAFILGRSGAGLRTVMRKKSKILMQLGLMAAAAALVCRVGGGAELLLQNLHRPRAAGRRSHYQIRSLMADV